MTDTYANPGSLASIQTTLTRLQEADPGIFITRATPDSIAEPLVQGRLAGLSLAIKDNIHVARMPNTAGTKAMESLIQMKMLQ